MSLVNRNAATLHVGDCVLIRAGFRTPYSNQRGTLKEIASGDPLGPYLVHFDDGMEFRYRPNELDKIGDEPAGSGRDANPS